MSHLDDDAADEFPTDMNLEERYAEADSDDVYNRLQQTDKQWSDLMVALHDDPVEMLKNAYEVGEAPFNVPDGPFSAVRAAMRRSLYENITTPGMKTFIILTNAFQAAYFVDWLGFASEIKRYRLLENTTFVIPDIVLNDLAYCHSSVSSSVEQTMKSALANFTVGLTHVPVQSHAPDSSAKGIAILDIQADYDRQFGRQSVFTVFDDQVGADELLLLDSKALTTAVGAVPQTLSRSDVRWLTAGDMSAVLSPLFNDQLKPYEYVFDVDVPTHDDPIMQIVMDRSHAESLEDKKSLWTFPRKLVVSSDWVQNQRENNREVDLALTACGLAPLPRRRLA